MKPTTPIFLLFAIAILGAAVALYSHSINKSKASRSFDTKPFEEVYDHEMHCRVLLGCLLSSKGKKYKLADMVMQSGIIAKLEVITLNFDGILLSQTIHGGVSEGIDSLTIADNAKIKRSTEEIVVSAIKEFGKNGKLKVCMGPFVYPRSCAEWQCSDKDEKDCVTLTLNK